MTDDTTLPFAFPAAQRKKVTAAFDGGRITSDGGVMLLAEAERRLGIAAKLAAAIPDGRDASRVIHPLADILRARIFAIACGYEDACDLDSLRSDPAFKLACGRLPDSGRDLCSQPTMSRWENAPDLRSVIRLGRVLLDLWLVSYPAPPAQVTLDIDDTCDVVHGHQQLSLFNAHYDERLSIGMQKGPPIGIEKGPLFEQRRMEACPGRSYAVPDSTKCFELVQWRSSPCRIRVCCRRQPLPTERVNDFETVGFGV